MTNNINDPKVIVITGASSGIGKALAEQYANNGIILALTGRDNERLEQTAIKCRNNGASVITGNIDVTDRLAMEEWLISIDNKHHVDLIIANAGISAGTKGSLNSENPKQIYDIFNVNLNGVLNTITPLQESMIARKCGQIAIMSSLAGYRGWSGAPAYCGSKAAVKVYGEAMRGALKCYNVQVNVICPGFIKSRITDMNDFPMPFLMDTNKAAKVIIKGLSKNKGRISLPLITSFMAWILMILPDELAQSLLSFSPKK